LFQKEVVAPKLLCVCKRSVLINPKGEKE